MLGLPSIVTSGVDSEYVLGGLSSYLKNMGYRVHELDFAKFHEDPLPLLKRLNKQKTIYITSAHTNLTKTTASYLAPEFPKLYPNYLAPIEIIPILNPQLSIYIPHDLLTPYGDNNLAEIRLLDIFDYILTTSEADKKILEAILPPSTQIFSAGWIKYIESERLQPIKNRFPTLLFISMIGHLRAKFGIEGVVNYLRPLLTDEIYIKLPAWKNIEFIEDAIRKQTSAHVISSSESSINLIQQADLIVCNGASSIHAEASMIGKPVICLLDNEGVSAEYQRRKLAHFENIFFYDYREKKPFTKQLLAQVKSQEKKSYLQPFAYKEVLALLNRHC